VQWLNGFNKEQNSAGIVWLDLAKFGRVTATSLKDNITIMRTALADNVMFTVCLRLGIYIYK
jgi:hypothetical protein